MTSLRVLTLAAGAVLLGSAAGPAPPDPYQILSRARTCWESQRYPAMVDYTIHTSAMRLGKPDERHYTARWLAATGEVQIHPVSVEEAAHPYIPGTGFNFGPFSIGGPHDGGGVKGDLLGLPLLAPNFAFGIARYVPPSALTPAQLVAQIRERFHDPAPEKVAALDRAQGPAVIATVTSSKRDYAVTLAGIEPYGDHRDYHLHLTPLRDPGRLRLRDLWIDARTFATDRLDQRGNFTDGPSPGVPWTVTFRDVDGARYIESESTASPLATGFRSSLQAFSLTFEDIAPGAGRFWPGIPGASPRLEEPTER